MATQYELSKMRSETGTYTKDQLLTYLHHACPEALDKFPPPDAFEIGEPYPGRYALNVGHTVTKKARKIKNELWLMERDPITQNLFDGLYYYTLEDGSANKYVKNAKGFKGKGFFSSMSKSGIITPFSLRMKALLRFVLLYCGRVAEYKTSGYGDVYLEVLTRALKAMAKHTPTATTIIEQQGDGSTPEDSDDASVDTEEAGDLFVTEDGDKAPDKGKKRKGVMDAELDVCAPAKKSHAC